MSHLSKMNEDNFEEVKFPPPLFWKWKSVPLLRGEPLSELKFNSLLDCDGRLLNEQKLREIIFKGGIDTKLRPKVWKLLFGKDLFKCTYREREVITEERHAVYQALKLRLSQLYPPEEMPTPEYESLPYQSEVSLSPLQSMVSITETASMSAKFAAAKFNFDKKSFSDSIVAIDKDVPRNDRCVPFFMKSFNLHVLRDILIVYAAFHPKTGYAQGMCEIAGQFLNVLLSEVEAFWCFKYFMDEFHHEFEANTVFEKLRKAKTLLQYLDPALHDYLEFLNLGDLAVCHRWVLLRFKREFSWEDSVRCFEIVSSHFLSSNHANDCCNLLLEEQGSRHWQSGVVAPLNDVGLDVFMCICLLISNRDKIFACHDVAQIYQTVLSLSTNLNLNELLCHTEDLFSIYCNKMAGESFELVDG